MQTSRGDLAAQAVACAALVMTLAACAGESAPAGQLALRGPDGSTPDTSSPSDDPAGGEVFDDTIVHSVALELGASDWQAIIDEAAAYENTNPRRPYYRARVTFDGETLDGDIGVRLKGHISIELSDGHSFPLKLDFNRYVSGSRLDGLKKLNLNTNFNGPSWPIMRDYLSYGAWREFGVAASRTSFATVSVNDEDLGLYVLVEQVDGQFVKRSFQAPRGDLYKPEQISGGLEYRGPAIADYPDIGHKWPDQSNHASLLHALQVLDSGSTAEIAEVFEVTGVLTYLAGNVALGSWDCYPMTGHNYYLYESVPGRFTMLPWDMNGSLERAHEFTTCSPRHGFLSGKLLRDREHDRQYREILSKFLETAGSGDRLIRRLNTAADLIATVARTEGLDALREDITARAAFIEADLASTASCR